MNRALLTSRDPILLFDALPLYESELEDNGVSHVRRALTNKTMPCSLRRPAVAPAARGVLLLLQPRLSGCRPCPNQNTSACSRAVWCSVKVRLMPRCWLVLLRFYLRVDKVAVRLRETRYFCQVSVCVMVSARSSAW